MTGLDFRWKSSSRSLVVSYWSSCIDRPSSFCWSSDDRSAWTCHPFFLIVNYGNFIPFLDRFRLTEWSETTWYADSATPTSTDTLIPSLVLPFLRGGSMHFWELAKKSNGSARKLQTVSLTYEPQVARVFNVERVVATTREYQEFHRLRMAVDSVRWSETGLIPFRLQRRVGIIYIEWWLGATH